MDLLIIVLVCLSQMPDAEIAFTLDELVAGNEQAMELVQQIELEMEHVRQFTVRGKSFPRPGNERDVWRWAMRGRQERIRYETADPPTAEGLPQGLYDWFTDETTVSMLRNWDPKDPQMITPGQQGTVSASVLPRTRNPGSARDPREYLHWTFLDAVSGRWRTLAEWVRASPGSKLTGIVMIDGHKTYQIHVDRPPPADAPESQHFFDFFVDPAVNFAVRRYVHYQGGQQKEIDGKSETYGIEIISTVQEFSDFGDGVFIPILIERRLTASTSDQRRMLMHTRVRNLTVNEPLSEDALDFRFPENALVVYGPPDRPDRQRVVLWGADNQPQKEIASSTDMDEFVENLPSPAQELGTGSEPPAERSIGLLFWLNMGGLAAIAVWLAYRRRLRGRKGSV